jgi:homoserine kinase type II
MAVYTPVADDDLKAVIAGYDIGDVVACTGIAQGIENSNFRLQTTVGPFILTLYEKRVRPEDLPFYLDLMSHLAASGFHCPTPVADRDGVMLQTLSGRPAAIVTVLDGAGLPETDISPAHCRDVGAAAARLHIAGSDFPSERANDLSVETWRPLFLPLAERVDTYSVGLAHWIDSELSFLEQNWPSGLPAGTVHTDMFPDNVFFRDGALSGVIDFYFACTDMLALDLAVCLNAWCFDRDARFIPANAQALIDGYQARRRLDAAEQQALPILAGGMAMRFLLTRLHDWFHTPNDALATRKDPLNLLPLVEFHRSVSDSTSYVVR